MLFESQTLGCTICPTPIHIFTDVDGIDKYVIIERGGSPTPITQACCEYINNNSGNAEWVPSKIGYCKANFCEPVVFKEGINSVGTTEECCTQQGFYWDSSINRCYKCNPNVDVINSIINGNSVTEYVTYGLDGKRIPIASYECCEVVKGTLIKDTSDNYRCVKQLVVNNSFKR